LRGGIYGNAALKSNLRDLQCDDFLMGVQGLVNQTALMKQFPMTPEISNALQQTISLLNDVTNGCFENQFPSYHIHGSNPFVDVALRPTQDSAAVLPLPSHQAAAASLSFSAQHRPPESAAAGLHQNQVPAAIQPLQAPVAFTAPAAFALPQAPAAFKVPGSMDVRYAWFRYHCKGADKQGLWRGKTTQDIDASVSGKERDTMREMFNKALHVCRMLQGKNSNAEVDRIGVEAAFDRCKTKVTTHWGCDILDNGNAAVRTVYQYMTGKSINSFANLDIQKCKTYRQSCLDSAWVNPSALCQSDIRANPMNSYNEKSNGSEDDSAGPDRNVEGDSAGPDINVEDDSAGPDINVEDHDAQSSDISEIINDVDNASSTSSATGLITSVVSAQQPVLRDTLPHTECFVCAICRPIRLFTKWAQYLSHYRSHIQDGGQVRFQVPEKDEVQVVLGVKLDARKTSQYAPVSKPYWKAYSPESKYQFLRRRILNRKVLQTGDKIKVMFSESGECKFALVLDPVLSVIQKAHYVNSVQFLKDDNESFDPSLEAQRVYVTSILQHWPLRAHPIHFSGGNMNAASSARCAGSAQPSPTTRASRLHSPSRVQANLEQPFSQEPTNILRPLPSSTLPEHATFKGLSSHAAHCVATAAELQEFKSAAAAISPFATPAIAMGRITSQQAASVATTQPHRATTLPRPKFRQNLSQLFNAATSNRGGAATAFAVSARPTVGQSAVECTPLSDSDAQLDIGALIMLRDVAQLGTCLRLPLMPVAKQHCYTPTVGIRGSVKFPIFEFEQAAFIIDDYGTNFTDVYPDHVQKVLDVFKLNETNRCFFLALGIGTNIDPFLLQCLFRRHARFVTQNKTVLLNSIGGDADATGQLQGSIETELESLENVMKPGSSIDCFALRYLWPIEFDNFRIVVICKRLDREGVARYNVVVFNSSSADDVRIQACQDVERKQTIFLKLENAHYTLLTLVQGSVDVSDAHISQWFAHDINEGLRCPSITTMNFQEKVFPEAYVASSVDGTVPSADQVDAIWLQITARHGIAFGRKGEWQKGLPGGVATTNENQQGSIDAVSFDNVRNALLNALEAKDKSTDSITSSSSVRLSRSAVSVISQASSPCVHASVPCVFLDLGSESGRALVRMLHDARITHAAGVEHQIPWFQLSVTLFRDIRQAFIDAHFRMPAITLFRSCMLKTKPELAYIYAIASIAYMNNQVFDKAKVVEPLLVHLKKTDPSKRDLSANAAYALSKSFQNRTCIAVFKDEHFNAGYNYKHVFAVKVNPTWANWEKYSMFIKSLQQHVVIAPQSCLLCASYEEVSNFQEVMRSWSNALAPAYAIIQQNKYYESQVRLVDKGRNKSRNTRLRHGHVQIECSSDSSSEDGLDTSLLEAVVPSQVFNSGPVPPQVILDIQSLATLQPRKLLSQKVIEEYMSLLGKHFNTTSFCPFLMDGIAWDALHSPSRKFSEKERSTFCRKYFQLTLTSPEKPIVFAMNAWGNHWIALKIDMTKKYIATACSLNNVMKQLAQGVLQMISSQHKPASAFEHISVKVPHQKNAVDCGPLSCLFMLFLAHNNIIRSTTMDYDSEFTAVAMRLRIAADIVNKTLTPLVTQ
jgi:hypothetical protein